MELLVLQPSLVSTRRAPGDLVPGDRPGISKINLTRACGSFAYPQVALDRQHVFSPIPHTNASVLYNVSPPVNLGSSNRCDLSDALLKLGYRNGGFLAGPTLFSPERQAGGTKIVGPAYTVEYAKLDDPRPKVSKHYVSESQNVTRANFRLITSPPALWCSSPVPQIFRMLYMGA